jgi:ATP-dependent DNA helicase RecQ
VRFTEPRSIPPVAFFAFHGRLRARADGAAVEMDAPENDSDRLALAIAERAGAVTLEPIGGRALRVHLDGPLEEWEVKRMCRVATDRGWRAYRAIEAFAFGETCRRRALLEHFGDMSEPAPGARCCDFCDPAGAPVAPSQAEIRVLDRRIKAARLPDGGLSPDPAILDALVAWRRETAGDKPAYTVANNVTLELIAHHRPASPAELGALKGVGPAFLERHADRVLAIVAAGG